MAAGDPVEIAVPADTWVAAAVNVKTGSVSILSPTNNDWYWTQRSTGSAAPSDNPEVKLNFQTSEIDSDVFIDVYVYVKNNDGRVSVI